MLQLDTFLRPPSLACDFFRSVPEGHSYAVVATAFHGGAVLGTLGHRPIRAHRRPALIRLQGRHCQSKVRIFPDD